VSAEATAAASPLMATYRPAPVCFVEGRGTELYDATGRRYLDFLSGIAVTSLGHGFPAVTEAIASQAARLIHVSNLFENGLAAPLATELDRLIGDGTPPNGQVFFANSGAEANECAIKLARRASPSGRYSVISALGSFHGRTLATLAATGQPAKHAGFEPLPAGFTHVPYDDLDGMASACAEPSVAAVLLEAIQGEAGVVEPDPAYLAGVRQICDERGVLLILDEIQTGLGRTGRWFGFQRGGVVPDIVTVAKALGNGMPIGACWARAEVAAAFRPGDHGTTFGGQPLACAAGLATLRAMDSLDLPSRAAAGGRRLAAALAETPGVASVRGQGLLLGVVLEEHLDSTAVATAALAAGLVLNAPVPGVLRLAPPLIVSDDEIDEAAGLLASVLL